MAAQKIVGHSRCGRLPDGVGHIQREKVARIEKAVHRSQVDVIGVQIIRARPTEFVHGAIGGGARARGLRADDQVLAIRLIPDRDDNGALARRQHAGG
jgi:hypothetical protein